MNADNEVTSQQSEILLRNEISNRFEFTSVSCKRALKGKYIISLLLMTSISSKRKKYYRSCYFLKQWNEHIYLLQNKTKTVFPASFKKKNQSSEAAGVLSEKLILEIWQDSQENTCAKVSILINLQASALRPQTLEEVFCCEFFVNF